MFMVFDNGKWITEDEIRAKNEDLDHYIMKKQSSIGISNVNRRLKAVYGKPYGIHIEVRQGGGLRVILSFKPVKSEERGEEEL